MNKKAAIIEFANSHDECFYSQILFLKKAGYEVYIICSSLLKDRIRESYGKVDFFCFSNGLGVFNNFKNLLVIRKFLIKNKINTIILNSAHGIQARNFILLPFPFKITITGILHDTEKIIKSSNQKIINRKIKKYFVLSDHVLDYVNSLNVELKFQSFYPVIQPDFNNKVMKMPNEFWICIPGRVEQKRRDYQTLFNCLDKMQLPDNVKIILLGRTDKELIPPLKNLTAKNNLQNQLIAFDEYIPNSIFYSYLKNCDVVLPLIHPSEKWFDKYSRTQISGSFNMAYTYKIPLLCEKSFAHFEDFKDTSFFYEIENLIPLINQLSENNGFFISRKKEMYKLPKWSFDYQNKKYLDFLEV